MKIRNKIISLMLAVIMLVMALPVTAFAAKGETYIKEIRMSAALKAADAKKFLTDNGYTVIDVDVNQRSGKECVYIGYKTTTNPDEAITDIALMQMDGGYSFSEYEALLERKMNEINGMLDSIGECIKEARANLAAGKSNAQGARDVLNFFVEDDSGMFLGDYLLGTEPSREDIVKIFLQSNSDIASMIYNMLAFACTDNGEETNWLAKLENVDVWGDYDPLLYSDAASAMFDSFLNIHDMMVIFEEEYKGFAEELTTNPEYAELTEEQIRDLLPNSYAEYAVIHDALSSYNYGGKPLLDFFMKDPYEIDVDELFPIVSALSVGQQQIIKFVGLTSLISYAQSTEETAADFIETIKGSFALFGKYETVSVYYGVDRSLFEDGGVALTTASLRKSATTGDNSWFSGDNIDPVLSACLHAAAGAFAGVAIGAAIYGKMAKNAASAIYKTAMQSELLEAAYQVRWMQFELEKQANLLVARSEGALSYVDAFDQAIKGKSADIARFSSADYAKTVAKEASSKMAKIGLTANVIAGVAMGISLIIEGINMGIRVYNYYNQHEYSEIPRAMVDEVLTSTDSYYVNYYAVKNQDGNPGDLNAWRADRWNALYTTTDKRAGDPIIASSIMVKLKDNKFPSDDHGAVHYFGETAAADVNRYHLRTAPATYMFYKRDHSLSMTASTFSGGELVMFAGFGLLGGVAIGGFGVIGAGKLKTKKDEEAEPETEPASA